MVVYGVIHGMAVCARYMHHLYHQEWPTAANHNMSTLDINMLQSAPVGDSC